MQEKMKANVPAGRVTAAVCLVCFSWNDYFGGRNAMGRKHLYENDSPLVLCLDVCSNSLHTTLKTVALCPKKSLVSGLWLFVSGQSYSDSKIHH